MPTADPDNTIDAQPQIRPETGTAIPSGLTTITIDTPSLGDRSYLVHDGEVAFVVDPQRDIDRVLALLEQHGLRLLHVFETHIHNDYVTGGLALARQVGATYHVNAKDPVAFDRAAIADGDLVEIGDRMRVIALATPGHTYNHLSYALADTETDLARAVGVFTGGSLLFGATGRPDLLGPEHTDALVRLQHGSARMLATVLPGTAEVYPTHGFGSFCSATQSAAELSTIAGEARTNPALLLDERAYIRDLLAGLDEWPAYYAAMSQINLAGTDRAEFVAPTRLTSDQVRARVAAGDWVVDVRPRAEFAAGHVPGTVNIGLDGSFATYLGWLHEQGTPITLLATSAADVTDAQRELFRIGIERLDVATGPLREIGLRAGEQPARYRRAGFAELADAFRAAPPVILDVRRVHEYAESHIEGALNIPLQHLRARLRHVPDGQVWVHCAGGYRASIAASILTSAGRDVVAVDDDFGYASAAGLPLAGAHPGAALADV